jgi:alcohol dehydrogenase
VLGSNGWANQDIIALLELVRAGKLQALVDETFPLERAGEALQRIEDRKVFGKLVITP